MSRKTKANLLARPEVQGELNKIKVAIKRDIIASGPIVPIIRSIDDFTKLKIHRAGEGSAPLFDREDVICNEIDYKEQIANRQDQASRLIYQNTTLNSHLEKEQECTERESPKRNDRGESSCSCDRDRSRSSQERGNSLRPGEFRPSKRQREEREYYSSSKRDRSYSPRWHRKRSRSRSAPRRQRSSSPPLRPGEYRPKKRHLEERYDTRRENRRQTSRSPDRHSRLETHYPPYFSPNFPPPHFPGYMPVPMYYPYPRGPPPYTTGPGPFVPLFHQRFPKYNNTKGTASVSTATTGSQKVSPEQPETTADKDNLNKFT